MTVAQWLNVEESKHLLALEQLESWNVAWRGTLLLYFVRQLFLEMPGFNQPLIILQKIQEAIVEFVNTVTGPDC